MQAPHFAARYKEPHELAGLHVERGRECGCGQWFPQYAVSRRYLAEHDDGRAFVTREECEVEQLRKGEVMWWPKRCHHCLRRTTVAPLV